MTTSGVYSFSVSRDDIIREALLNIRKLDELETPTPTETVDCSRKLNMIVKQWQGRADFAPGLKTWTRRHGHLFLSSATGQYTLGPSGTGWTNSYSYTTLAAPAAGGQPAITVGSTTIVAGQYIGVELTSGALFWTTVLTAVGTAVTLAANLPSAAVSGNAAFTYTTTAQQPVVIETAFLRDFDLTDTPINIIRNVADYDFLPSKNDPSFVSDPTAIYYEFQLGNSTLYTDVAAAQDVRKHLCFSYLEAVQDFVNPTDTPEYPQEWYLALSWELSMQIAPMYGATWTTLMQANRDQAIAIAKRKEPEINTMHFQPYGE